jgi:hypothetical protein
MENIGLSVMIPVFRFLPMRGISKFDALVKLTDMLTFSTTDICDVFKLFDQ